MGHEWKDECPTCRKEVTTNEAGLCCDSCDRWLHATCEGISQDTYKRFQRIDDEWFCKACKITQRQPTKQHILHGRLSNLRVSTLNCRGIRSEQKGNTKKMHIAEDMKSYKLDVLAIQETHMGGEAPEEITTADGRDKYILYHSNMNKQKKIHAGSQRQGGNICQL